MGTHEEQDVARQRFDVADAVPLLLDARGMVVSWTRDAQRLLRYTAAEVVGTGVAGLLHDEDAARLPELAERCRRDGGWAGLLTARRKGGRQSRSWCGSLRPRSREAPRRWLVLLCDMAGAPGWDMSRSVLEQMVTGSPVGIAIVDANLRCVWSNAALEQFGGGPAGERLGRRMSEIQPGLDAEAVDAQMRQVLETGEPVFGYEQVGQVRSAPHRETAHMLSFTRLEDDHGHPMGVYYTVVDITERHRARQRLALLDRAGERIGRTLDIVRTAQELADVAVPDCADFVSVDLLESVLRGAELAPGPLSATPVPLRRAGHQSVNPGAPEAAVPIGEAAAYLPGSPPIRCLATGSSWRRSGSIRSPRRGPPTVSAAGRRPSWSWGCTA